LNWLGKILLKALSLFYFVMAMVGFLGYFGVEKYTTKYFSFFYNLLGRYAIALPIICLIFTGICWGISRTQPQNTAENTPENRAEPETGRRVHRSGNPSGNAKSSGKRYRQYSDTGFSSYFRGDLSIKDESDPLPLQKRFENIGTNFSTYFGQGRTNIYLPAKAVYLQGFRDYFKDRNPLVKEYDQAVSEPVRGQSTIEAQNRILPNKQFFPSMPVLGKDFSVQRTPITIEKTPITKERSSIIQKTEDDRGIENMKTNGWELPSLDLLHPVKTTDINNEQQQPKLLEEVLSTFGVTAKVIHISNGPVTTRYELSPAPGTKISKIVNLSDDIAMALASRDIRIEAPIPGKAAVGIEIPRKNPRTVFFREVLDSAQFDNAKSKLKVVLGKDIADTAVVGELERMPHLLVAGATGSGKSIFINCLINSLLYTVTPDEVRFLLIDPKMVELNLYNGIPHLLTPVVTDPKKANKYLRFIVKEMENRYELFASSGVRDIDHYNKTMDHKKLPYIVVIIDELADLMMVASNEIEESICRLAQMARAAGIHLVIATQRPSVNVITGLIKANIPSRISFAVSSQIDSRTILDAGGAEKLLGKGDMLYSPIGLNKPLRVHGCFIDEQEVKKVIGHWKRQGEPKYGISEDQLEESVSVQVKEEDFDDRFVEAGELVITTGVASVSFLQRRLRVGYSRAARLMDMLEEAGVVGGHEGNKPRDILMSLEMYNERYCS